MHGAWWEGWMKYNWIQMYFLYSYWLCYCRCTFRWAQMYNTFRCAPYHYSETNGLRENSHIQLHVVALNNLFFCFCMSCAWTCFSSLHAHSCSSLILAVLSNSEFSFCIKRHLFFTSVALLKSMAWIPTKCEKP